VYGDQPFHASDRSTPGPLGMRRWSPVVRGWKITPRAIESPDGEPESPQPVIPRSAIRLSRQAIADTPSSGDSPRLRGVWAARGGTTCWDCRPVWLLGLAAGLAPRVAGVA